jgi:hypothetical protein
MARFLYSVRRPAPRLRSSKFQRCGYSWLVENEDLVHDPRRVRQSATGFLGRYFGKANFYITSKCALVLPSRA